MRGLLTAVCPRRSPALLVAALLGTAALVNGQAPTDAEARLLDEVARHPDDPEPLLDLARYYALTLRFSEAGERARQAQAAMQPLRARGGAAEDRRSNVAGRGAAMPTKTTHVNPTYPAPAAAAEIEGILLLDLVVRADGKVRDVRVVRSIRELDDAAIAAGRQWQYDPDSVRGPSGSVIVPVMVGFSLSTIGEAANLLDLARWLLGKRRYADAEAALTRGLELLDKQREDCRYDGQPIRVGGDVLPPRKIKDVRPRHPFAGRRGRATGRAPATSIVQIEAVIGRAGVLCSALVVKSAGLPFDEAALRAVRRWEFAPSLLAGVAIPVATTVMVTFNIR